MIHELKFSDQYFEDVLHGRKCFELRNNDRGYLVDDTLMLREINSFIIYTGRWMRVSVTYVFDDTRYGLPENMVILGLSEVEANGENDLDFSELHPEN